MLSACEKNKEDAPPIPPNPTVTSVSPTSAGYNALITIKGSNFSNTLADNQITINGIAAIVKSATDSVITVLVPERAGSGPIEVTTPKGKVSGGAFTYTPTVYVAGSEINGNHYEAKYWKDGIEIVLRDSAVANVIVANGNDLYIGGNALDASTGKAQAIIWKNGVANYLTTNNLTAGSVLSVFISGSDVYAAGTAIDDIALSNVGLYWKNGVPIVLSGTSGSSVGYSISVVGTDVYVAGISWDNANGSNFWKNNLSLPLAPTNTITNALGLFTSVNDVFVAGYFIDTSTKNSVATYWKNGIVHSLTDGTHSSAANAITVSGDDVYVAGYEMSGTNYVAKYWKNGTPVSLTDASKNAQANSIQVLGNDIFVSGNEHIGNNDAARYWKNGIQVNLSDGTNQAQAHSIYVQ
jgi:hypothetical protein